MLTRQEVSNWKMDPVTKEITRRFNEDIHRMLADWAAGTYDTFSKGERARGVIEGITMVLNVEGDEDEL